MRVSVTYSGPGGSAEDWFEGVTKSIFDQIGDVIVEGAQRGEQITKHNIETRGTMKSGKRGRVESGDMRDAVKSKTLEKSNKRVSSEFGWIDEVKPYFGYQEEGFTHVSGVSVDGMYAISDAAEEVIQDVREDVGRIVRNA